MRPTAVALKLLVTSSTWRHKTAQEAGLLCAKKHASALVPRFNAHFFSKRKFLAGRILEVPLIVLQYYKPSFSLYIHIKKDHDLSIYNYYKFYNYKFILFINLQSRSY